VCEVYIVKIAAIATLIVLFASFATLPSLIVAQEATFGISPDLHASFEVAYALEATSISMTPAHREKVAAIIRTYNNGNVSGRDAAKRIDAVLSPGELDALSEIERSFWTSMLRIYANASNGDPLNASLEESSVEMEPGDFLLMLFGSPAPTTSSLQ
jgi:hypothetical protein